MSDTDKAATWTRQVVDLPQISPGPGRWPPRAAPPSSLSHKLRISPHILHKTPLGLSLLIMLNVNKTVTNWPVKSHRHSFILGAWQKDKDSSCWVNEMIARVTVSFGMIASQIHVTCSRIRISVFSLLGSRNYFASSINSNR